MKYVLLYSLLMMTSVTHASSFADYWRNPNQRATALMQQEKFEQAEKTFTRKDWQAVAAFRGKNYAKAEKGFQNQGGAEGLYNQGNALAFQGKYKQAIEAYTKALKLEPKHLDAEYNRALLEAMLKNNPPESDSSDSDKDKGNSNQEQPPKDGANQNTSDQKQDGSNNTPSKPESPESGPPSESPSEPETGPESEPPPESEAEPKEGTGKNDKPSPESSQHADASLTDADKQAKEQWLRLIPDDPGGLLREKFWRDHMKRLPQRRS